LELCTPSFGWLEPPIVTADCTGELSNRFRLQLQVWVFERLERNPILQGRVYERTHTQSTDVKNVFTFLYFKIKNAFLTFFIFPTFFSYNNMQLKETGLFDVRTEQRLRKYLSSIYTQFVYLFISILVAT